MRPLRKLELVGLVAATVVLGASPATAGVPPAPVFGFPDLTVEGSEGSVGSGVFGGCRDSGQAARPYTNPIYGYSYFRVEVRNIRETTQRFAVTSRSRQEFPLHRVQIARVDGVKNITELFVADEYRTRRLGPRDHVTLQFVPSRIDGEFAKLCVTAHALDPVAGRDSVKLVVGSRR